MGGASAEYFVVRSASSITHSRFAVYSEGRAHRAFSVGFPLSGSRISARDAVLVIGTGTIASFVIRAFASRARQDSRAESST
jgi:threonine dehydrogenase-like Zn-dependent dehydrogenase